MDPFNKMRKIEQAIDALNCFKSGAGQVMAGYNSDSGTISKVQEDLAFSQA